MYENILTALGSQTPSGSLTYEEQAQNYTLFSELMKKGVKLQDLVDQANAPKEPSIDEGLFLAMETTVQDVLEVKSAKKAQKEAINRVIMQFCAKDPGYQAANKAYRDAVIKAYTEKKENTTEQ